MKRFLKIEQNGIIIYHEPGIVLNAPSLKIDLGGFWIFKWLKLHGAAEAAGACAL
jgi:hypothetical protein